MSRFTTAASPLHTIEITGSEADVTVRTSTEITEAVLEINGLPEGVEAQTFEGGVWRVKLPAADGRSKTSSFTSREGGRTINNIMGDVTGGQVLQAGDINGNVFFDGQGDMIFGNNGQVTVGGQAHNGIQDGQERITIDLLIPSGVGLKAQIDAGKIDTFDADLDVVKLHTSSGDVHVGQATDIYVHSNTGNVDVREVVGTAEITTRTGRIDVEGGTTLTLETYTGAIRWSATREATITAHSKKGNITVRSEGHRISSDLKSRAGRVREA